MNFDEYQVEARKTAIYPTQHRVIYPALGLGGESGECLEKIKKHIRDDTPIDELREHMTKELGDVLWYVAALAGDLSISMGDVAQRNIEKLRSRQERNVITGSGDNR